MALSQNKRVILYALRDRVFNSFSFCGFDVSFFHSPPSFQDFLAPGPPKRLVHIKKNHAFLVKIFMAVSQNKRVISFMLFAIRFSPRLVYAISMYRFSLSRRVSKIFSPPGPPKKLQILFLIPLNFLGGPGGRNL